MNNNNINIKPDPEQQPPPIYITSPETSHQHQHQHHHHHNQQQQQQQQMQNLYLGAGQEHSPSPSPPPHTPPQVHNQQLQQLQQQQQQSQLQQQQQQQQHDQIIPSRPSVPLTVQTQNLQQPTTIITTTAQIDNRGLQINIDGSQSSPQQLSPHQMAIQTPLPPSPSPSAFLSDDEAASLYSPHSPHTPSIMSHSNSSGHLAADNFGLQTSSAALNVQQLGYNNMQS